MSRPLFAIAPLSALFIPLPAKIVPNKLAPNVVNNILWNPLFYSLASLWIASLTPSGNKPEYSRDSTIAIISSISSFDFISVVVCRVEDEERPDPKIFWCIPASDADAAAVNPKGIKTLLAYNLITFFISGRPVFNNGPTSIPRNPPDCIILDIWLSDNLISTDDLLVKALQKFATCLLVNNGL